MYPIVSGSNLEYISNTQSRSLSQLEVGFFWPMVEEVLKIEEGSVGWLDWICLTTTHVLEDILAVLHR